MEHLSMTQVITLLVLAILIPGALVHLTLGRDGGHHLFDKSLSKKEIRELPLSMLMFRIRNNLIGSLSVLLGMVFVISITRVVCDVFGIATDQDFWIMVSIFSFVALVVIRYLIFHYRHSK